jgi:hypothetical protein
MNMDHAFRMRRFAERFRRTEEILNIFEIGFNKRQERIFAEGINVGDLSLNVQPDSCPR